MRPVIFLSYCFKTFISAKIIKMTHLKFHKSICRIFDRFPELVESKSQKPRVEMFELYK